MNFIDGRVANLKAYVPGEQPQTKDYIKLNTNESAYLPAPGIKEAAAMATKDLQLYADPTCQKLREKLGGYFSLPQEYLFVGNGSDEVLAFCFQSLMGQGVAYPEISYGFYQVFAELYALKKTPVPLGDDLTIDLSAYPKNQTIIIANPNAPTSLSLPAAEILRVVKADPKRLVIVDEAYVEFGGESLVPYVSEYENLLVVGTFSKAWQLAGARLGYGVGNPRLINELNRVKFSFNPYSVNSMTAACGIAALDDLTYHQKCLTETVNIRQWSSEEFKKLGFEVLPSKTNFLFVKHPQLSGRFLYPALKAEKILVRWFEDEKIADYLRITIGTKEQMTTLMAVLEKLLAEMITQKEAKTCE